MSRAAFVLPTQLLDRGVAFLDRVSADATIQIECVYDAAVDATRLARAAELALVVEPLLACRFVEHRLAPYWERPAAPDAPVFECAADAAAYAAFTRRPIEAELAPRLRVCLLPAADGTRVAFKVCHRASDATGVKYVVGLVARLYRRLAAQPQLAPAPRTFDRGVAQVLAQIPTAQLPRLYAAHKAAQHGERTAPLTLPIAASAPEGLDFPQRTLDRAQVDALRRWVKARGATLNDALLAAFVRVLADQARWDGRSALRITSTVDFRRYLPGPPARGVANLSTTVAGFPDLGRELGDDYADTLQRVAAVTRAAKSGYLGVGALLASLVSLAPLRHGLARGIMHDGIRAELSGGRMENGVGNNGPIDVDDVTLDTRPRQAHMLPSPFYPPQFVIDVSGYDGTLTLVQGAYAAQRAATERFLDAMCAQLVVDAEPVARVDQPA